MKLFLTVLSLVLFGFWGTLVGQEWGEGSKSLQMRAICVASSTDEQEPNWEAAERTRQFELASDVTLFVQVKNVGEELVSLFGTLYGMNVTEPWPGKSQQTSFGKFYFRYRIFDEDGNEITGTFPSTDLKHYQSSREEKLAPGEVIDLVLKPLSWNESLSCVYEARRYGRVQGLCTSPSAQLSNATV